MKARRWRDLLLQQEDLNFLLTNRIPRSAATWLMGWFSQIESPWLARLSIAVWRQFTKLDLGEAKEQQFRSLHACFVRELKDGARPVEQDPAVLVSPCDAIVGACGRVQQGQLWQAKGFPYSAADLFGNAARAVPFAEGIFVTLRLTSAMYHHFHAPHDATIHHVTHMAGDTWNVNPIALKRVERLFCKNERAAVHLKLAQGGHPIAMIPVAAILVASLRLHFLNLLIPARYPRRYSGPNELPCQVQVKKGEDLGWFQHGSTVIVFAPPGFALCEGVETGVQVRMGMPLMRLPENAPSAAT